MNVQDLKLDEGNKIDLELYEATQELLNTKQGGVKAWRYLVRGSAGIDVIEIQYNGFVVQFCFVKNTASRDWNPTESYDKNYFLTYIYKGRSEEFDARDDSLIRTYESGSVLNTSIVLDYPSYEKYYETVWLCFSSWKPYTGSCVYVSGPTQIEKDVGVFVILGTITDNTNVAHALNYIEPSEDDHIIDGNAIAVLIKHGQFINEPFI